MDNALIIFIKNPIKGKVKTRIARTVGDDRALAIYLELSKITRENVLLLMEHPEIVGRGVKIYLFYSDFIATDDDWSNTDFDKQVQVGKDLGERMSNAFDFVLKKHKYACIIGSDCPTLSVQIMQHAFAELSTYNYVLGPSTDGGYYLLGIKGNTKDVLKSTESFHDLFENMTWSTDQVLPETLKRIEKNHSTVFLLSELTDIDEEEDWLIFQKNKQIN